MFQNATLTLRHVHRRSKPLQLVKRTVSFITNVKNATAEKGTRQTPGRPWHRRLALTPLVKQAPTAQDIPAQIARVTRSQIRQDSHSVPVVTPFTLVCTQLKKVHPHARLVLGILRF